VRVAKWKLIVGTFTYLLIDFTHALINFLVVDFTTNRWCHPIESKLKIEKLTEKSIRYFKGSARLLQ